MKYFHVSIFKVLVNRENIVMRTDGHGEEMFVLKKRVAHALNTLFNSGSIHPYPNFDKISLLLKKAVRKQVAISG